MMNFRLVFYVILILSVLVSCVNDEDLIVDTGVEIPEEIRTVSDAPSILFSYNVVDLENEITTSWLIGVNGEVRKLEHGPSAIYHQPDLSFYDLNRMKSESIATNSTVRFEELVLNYEHLKEVEVVTYDETTESKTVTTLYGYFFRDVGVENSCSCSKSTPLSERFEYRLLQQKVEDDIIVSEGDDIISWISSLNLDAL